MAKPSVDKIIARQEILRLIQEKQPISLYALQKQFHYLSYGSIHKLINFLEKEGLVRTERKVINNKIVRLIFYVEGFEEKKEKKKKEEKEEIEIENVE